MPSLFSGSWPPGSKVMIRATSPVTTALRKNNWISASAGTVLLRLKGFGRDRLRACPFVHQRYERRDLVIPFDQSRLQTKTAHGIRIEIPRGIGYMRRMGINQ